MLPGISLIVGLGNPGPEYAETRHNAGFRFIDVVLKNTTVRLKHESRFPADMACTLIADRKVWLLQPTTFMNHSGEAVAKFAHYYKIPVEQILVIHDELDLPPGAVRLKRGGGDGGHNGLHDVIVQLSSADFMRLRVGIGHPGSSAQVVSYVLKKAPSAEQALIDAAIHTAWTHLEDMVCGRYQQVMNVMHTKI